MSRARRLKPSTREGRKRQAELGRVISNPRTLKTDREAALRELDALAPLENFGSPSLTPPARPTKDWKEALIDRVEARRAEGPVSDKGSLEEALAQLAVEDRARAIRKAENAPANEKAEAILAELPDHPLNKLARELAHYLWEQDLSNPKPPAEVGAKSHSYGWLARQPYNRHDVRGNTETVSNAVADVYRLLAERDTADPSWFVRRAKKLLEAPALPPVKVERAPEPETQASPANLQKEEEAMPSPTASADGLAQRVEMILKTDSFLRSLSAVNFELNEKIRSALTTELLRVGHIAGTFAALLYNSLRRESKLFGLPERRF